MSKQYLLEELSALAPREDPITLKIRTHVLVPDSDERVHTLWHLGRLLIHHKGLTGPFAKTSRKYVSLFLISVAFFSGEKEKNLQKCLSSV